MNIAILLTVYNRKEKTLRCLNSLVDSHAKAGSKIRYKVFLTDDGCTDGTREAIEKAGYGFAMCILQGDGNLYWNGGMIKSWKAAIADDEHYDGYLWLNDDAVVLPDFWKDLAVADDASMGKYGKKGIYVGSTYNTKGEFNVPYGGISYNKKHLTKKIEYFTNKELLEHLAKTKMCSLDFFEFLQKNKPNIDDFMFLDPPYDTEFNTYAKNTFDKSDQARLADYLKNNCDCYFMLIIKNTEFIYGLYQNSKDKNGRDIKIKKFDKKYMVSFQNRNNREAEHLIITNY